MTPVGTSDRAPEHRKASVMGQQDEKASRLASSATCSYRASHEEELEFSQNPVVVVDSNGLSAMGEVAASRGYLWVQLNAPGPQHRGRLGLYLEEAIEYRLEERGALPPGIHASTGLDASLSDQLYRARLVEMHGIVIGVPSLEGITNLGRILDAEDSAVLRWWLAATNDRPVRVVLSKENTSLRVYPSPVLFEALFDVVPSKVTPLPPSLLMTESSQSMELSDLPPRVEEAIESQQSHALAVEEELLPEGPEDHWGADIDLPDLDLALGLVDERTPETLVQAPHSEVAQKKTTKSSVNQLALDYESPQAPLVADSNAEAAENARLSPDEQSSVSSQNHAEGTQLLSPPRRELSETSDETEGSIAPTETASENGLELNAEEFLRTLEEDSQRVPEVEAVEALQTVEEKLSSRGSEVMTEETLTSVNFDEEEKVQGEVVSEPREPALDEEVRASEGAQSVAAPLPTKKIIRNPFIRMAQSVEVPVKPEVQPSESEHEPENSPEIALASTTQLESASPVGEVVMEETAVEVSGGEAPPAEAAPVPNTSKELSEQTQESQPAQRAISRSTQEADPSDPFNQLAARDWKKWVQNLIAARGPKPLSVIERMFVTDYTRLREAVRRGVAEPSANEILDEWQTSFATSYSQAFDALRMRGKRPTMVLDLPELAARLGRLQGARRVQLLLVDGLRFDLGLMVQDKMRATADAALTERLLLWSALPSVTSYQLDLLGKGPDGLKDKELAQRSNSVAPVASGEAARVPRRVRTGTLELLKLDIVEDSLRLQEIPVVERMDQIAEETAHALVEHLSKQPPRTMVVIFGDHGFSLNPLKAGTASEVSTGGASPEEILVPAFAWLTGAVH